MKRLKILGFRSAKLFGYTRKGLFVFLAKLLGPRCCGYIAARTLVKYYLQNDTEPTLLCLLRPAFSADVRELKRITKFNFVEVNMILLSGFMQAWTTPDMAKQIVYFSTVKSESCRWNKIKKFADSLTANIQKKSNLDVLVLPGHDYWQAYGLQLSFEAKHKPIVSLTREVPYSDQARDQVAKLLTGFKFTGNGIAVFGKRMRQALAQAQVIDEHSLELCTAPRLYGRDAKRMSNDGQNYVLLSFDGVGYGAQKVFDETLQEFARHARVNCSNRDRRYIVKTKDRSATARLLSKLAHDKRQQNLHVTHKIDLPSLLRSAKLVIGHNSLALTEALLFPVRIINPYWGDVAQFPEANSFNSGDHSVKNQIVFANTIEELRLELDKAANLEHGQGFDLLERIKAVNQVLEYKELQDQCDVERFIRRFV